MLAKLRFSPLIIAVLLCGCDGWSVDGIANECTRPPTPVERESGELGLGNFRWQCRGKGDPTCGSGEFPDAVAVGSSFNLTFSRGSRLPDEVSVLGIEPVGDSHVTKGLGYTVERAGRVTMVAMSHDAAVDFLELQLDAVDRISVSHLQEFAAPSDNLCNDAPLPSPHEGRRLEIFVGEPAEVQALPYSERGSRLGGNLEYEWESLTPDLVAVVPHAGRHAQLEPLAEGMAQVAVRAGGHEEVVEFEIEIAPERSGSESGVEPNHEGPRRNLPDDDTGTSEGTGGDDTSGDDSTGGDDTGGDDTTGDTQ